MAISSIAKSSQSDEDGLTVKRTWKRVAITIVGGLGLILVGAGVFMAVQWPKASLVSSPDSLARLNLTGATQRVSGVSVTVDNKSIPYVMTDGAIRPAVKLAVSTPTTVVVSLQRPSWIAWLAGKTEVIHQTVVTPNATLLDPVVFGSSSKPVLCYFSKPVRTVSVTGTDGTRVYHLAPATSAVSLLQVVGNSRAGILMVSASPDSWEKLPASSRLTYFQVSNTSPAAVISPAPTNLSPSTPITITLSQPIATIFGSKLPTITPVIKGANPIEGSWVKTTPYTLTYRPSAPDFWPSEQFTMTLPTPTALALQGGTLANPSTTVALQGASPSIMRLQQLLAQLNYLPLNWTPAPGTEPITGSAALAQSVLAPPSGSFGWRWQMPANLTSLWQAGSDNVITQGAVMSFEQFNHLDSNGLANPLLWPTLISDVATATVDPHPYAWIEVLKQRSETLNLYVNGSIVLSSLTNTGIPGLTTTDGTYPIYLRLAQSYMSGTNPDGTHYHDLVYWTNYFLGSEAVHGFYRAGYGYPQSLGCVELPISNAAVVFPQVHIGTLVTVVPQ